MHRTDRIKTILYRNKFISIELRKCLYYYNADLSEHLVIEVYNAKCGS